MQRIWLSLVFLAPLACGDDSDGGDVTFDARLPDAGLPADAGIDALPACEMPSHEGPCTIEYDTGNNGTIDKLVTYTWTGDELTKVEFDDNNDGANETVDNFFYDATGLLIRIEHDTGDNGTADRTEWRTYDSMGRLSHEEFDENGDGTADATRDHTYDAITGLESGQTTDIGIDASIDITATFSYDAAGNLIVAEYDYAAVPGDVNTVYTQEYDVRGNLIYRDSDIDGDGDSEAMEMWDHDSACNIVTYEKSGNEIFTETSTYDPDNNVLTEDHDDNSDSTIEIHRVFHYDCW